MPFDFDNEDVMPCEQMQGPVLAVRAHIWLADFDAEDAPHRFGGPLDLTVTGGDGQAMTLHRVLTLNLSDPRIGIAIPGVSELPLIYGFVHDGCELKYEVVSDREIRMLEPPGQPPANDWPYENFPAVFPTHAFGLQDDGVIDPEEFEELVWQEIRASDPDDAIVAIVPPSDSYGVSLWGDGDAELVQVVFEIDPAARTVVAYNQCG